MDRGRPLLGRSRAWRKGLARVGAYKLLERWDPLADLEGFEVIAVKRQQPHPGRHVAYACP